MSARRLPPASDGVSLNELLMTTDGPWTTKRVFVDSSFDPLRWPTLKLVDSTQPLREIHE